MINVARWQRKISEKKMATVKAEEEVVVGGVNALVLWPEGADKSQAQAHKKRSFKCVFLLHGRLGTRAHVRDAAEEFRRLGLMAVLVDNPNHGARLVDAARNGAWRNNASHSTDMYAQMVASVRDVQALVDFLPALLGVTLERTAVFGISQGGHTALLAMAAEPRLDVCVSVISSGDYKLNMELRYERLQASAAKSEPPFEVPAFSELYPDALDATVERYDPIRNTERLAAGGRPMLLLNGRADKLVPLACNVKLLKALAPLYEAQGAADQLCHTVFDGVGHETTPEMVAASKDWLKARL